MPATQQKFYPQGYAAQGAGDLVQVTNITHSLNNGSKQKHTLRQKGAGIAMGVEETTVNFDAILDDAGAERPYWRDCQRGVVRQLRIKLPGGQTLAIDGVYQQVNSDLPLDDAVKVSCTFIGKTQKQ